MPPIRRLALFILSAKRVHRNAAAGRPPAAASRGLYLVINSYGRRLNFPIAQRQGGRTGDGGDIADDRPPGWSMDREWNEEVPRVVGEIVGIVTKPTFQLEPRLFGDLAKITEELAPLKDILRKTNLKSQKLAESNLNAVFRVQPCNLRVAAFLSASGRRPRN